MATASVGVEVRDEELGAATDQLDQSLPDSETRTQAALADIQTLRDRLHSAVDARVSRLTELVHTTHSAASVGSVITLEVDSNAVRRIQRELTELGQVKVTPETTAFRFYKNHGMNVVLINDQHTAERKASCMNGIVLSSDPMQPNMMYEIRIDQTASQSEYKHVYLGVATISHDTLTLNSYFCSTSLMSAVVLHHDSVWVNGVENPSSVGSALRDVRDGGCVGLALDSSRQLCLYIDDRYQGVVAPNVTQPCFFMVDLFACWKKVTSLPVRPVT